MASLSVKRSIYNRNPRDQGKNSKIRGIRIIACSENRGTTVVVSHQMIMVKNQMQHSF